VKVLCKAHFFIFEHTERGINFNVASVHGVCDARKRGETLEFSLAAFLLK
jgi:hypothetical protein